MSKHKIEVGALLALVVAGGVGCASTPDQIRKSEPRVYQAAKPADLVAACIFERYDGASEATLLEVTRRSDGGKTVKQFVQKDPPVFSFVVDISPTSTGSVTRFYENLLVRQKDRDRMQACGSGQF